jgi:hypothetical protein
MTNSHVETSATRRDISYIRAFNFLRLGSWGDSLSAPWTVTSKIIDIVQPDTLTGYTHQWKTSQDPLLAEAKRYLMASCDDLYEENMAHTRGWGSYLATPILSKTKLEYATVVCPFTASKGEILCSSCGKCNGLSGIVHIRTEEHGARSQGKRAAAFKAQSFSV